MGYSIVCDPDELHGTLVERVMGGWSTVDNDLMQAVEPIFQNIVKAALKRNMETSQMNNVVMEKYEYSEPTQSITSCTSPFLRSFLATTSALYIIPSPKHEYHVPTLQGLLLIRCECSLA
jgi:hypothetical protein